MKTLFASFVIGLAVVTSLSHARVVWESKVDLGNNAIWIKKVALVTEEGTARIKASNLNKQRICEYMGYSEVAGSRVEFDETSIVVQIDRDVQAKRVLDFGSEFIENLNCRN